MGKKNRALGIMLPGFKLCYKVQSPKQYGSNKKKKTRSMDQWNRIESPETNPLLFGKSTTKETRLYNGEKITCLINGVEKNRTAICNRINHKTSGRKYLL